MFAMLHEKADEVLRTQFPGNTIAIQWTVPKESSFGDASLSLPLQLASLLKKKPREIAQVFVDALKTFPGVEKVEIAGAGYVNVWLTTEALLQELGESESAQSPTKLNKNEKPVIVDYSQPNIAKPLGVHHILSTVLGQALCNLHRHAGIPVVGWNYMGDWGTQFGKLAVAWEKWGDKKKSIETYTLDELLELYVRFHAEAEADAALDDAGRAAFRKLEQGDKELRAFWKGVVTVTKASLGDIYERLHVKFDTDIGESFYEDKMVPILDEGKKKGVFTEGKEGALIVEFPEESKLPPYLVQKGDGATLYATRDLAQIRYRIDTYQPQSILYVVDVAQQLYFQQLFATAQKLGWELPEIEHVVFGRMRFAESKMSTRKGTVLKLEHVLDEAVERAEAVIHEHRETIQTDDAAALAEMMGVGALVYGILSQNRKMDIVFDWDKMLSFDGNSAPYLQYTYARARSVLRKAGKETSTPSFPKAIAALTQSERVLIRMLLQFPGVLEDARESRMPHLLATYLFGLCQDFNAFYNVDPILLAEGSTKELRIALTAFSSNVLKTGAEILTLRVPEKM
ncbi:arginine--tRNA ligase [Candidatus Peribacteria bacterium]|nr:arginine--tRNA ligase [Candidatus Peribacteria bacterium]